MSVILDLNVTVTRIEMLKGKICSPLFILRSNKYVPGVITATLHDGSEQNL